jgi:hypothetical protein
VVWYKPSTWGESEARTLTAENNGRYLLDFAHGGGAFETAHVSQDRALTLSYVFAAVRVIAGTISTLPLKSYRDLGDSRQPMATLPRLFEDLRTSGQLRPWLHRFFASLALRGNAFGLIVSRDGFGFPTAIDWLDPSRVTINDAIPAARSTSSTAAWCAARTSSTSRGSRCRARCSACHRSARSPARWAPACTRRRTARTGSPVAASRPARSATPRSS